MILKYKTLDLFDKLLFETITLEPPFRKPNLMSNEACFLYVMEGEYHSISETEREIVCQEEALLMKCGNYVGRMESSGPSGKYQAVAIHFYPDVLSKIYENSFPKFFVGNTDVLSGMSKINSDILIKKYIDSILFYFENPNLVNQEILILKLKEIILLLYQTKNAPGVHQILSNLFNPVSHSFRKVIEAHRYSNVTLEELAQLTNTSLSTFKREFKRLYNSKPGAFLRNCKLEKSQQLLTKTDLNISEIALDCGFADISHFSKTFKNVHRMSPTEYRKIHSGQQR